MPIFRDSFGCAYRSEQKHDIRCKRTGSPGAPGLLAIHLLSRSSESPAPPVPFGSKIGDTGIPRSYTSLFFLGICSGRGKQSCGGSSMMWETIYRSFLENKNFIGIFTRGTHELFITNLNGFEICGKGNFCMHKMNELTVVELIC